MNNNKQDDRKEVLCDCPDGWVGMSECCERCGKRRVFQTQSAPAPPQPEQGEQPPMDECPNCHRSDGWHKAEGHPPPPGGDCRKIVWLITPDNMAYWGVRAYSGFDRGWTVNGREESDVVTYWMDGPHNPDYPLERTRRTV